MVRLGSEAARKPVRPSVRWGRLALLLLAASAALFALHAAITRRLLATPALRALLNTTSETSAIDWDEARSLVPGRVRVRGFRLYGNDGNVEWTIRLDEARLTYSLAELLARRFHVTSLSGRGLSFRAHPASLAARLAYRAPASNGKVPWTVRVDGISVNPVSEIAVEPYRFAGRARLTGRFRLTPGRAAEVGPAVIAIDTGDLRLGGAPMLTLDAGGRLAGRIAAWDPRQLPGGAVWRRVSGDVRLVGRIPRFDPLDRYFSGSALRLSGGSGRARLDGEIAAGVASAAVRLSAASVRASLDDVRLSGNAEGAIHLSRWRIEDGVADLDGTNLSLSDVVSVPDDSSAWWGRFRFVRGRLDRGVTARLEAECRDARPLLSIVGSGLPNWARKALSLEGLRLTAAVAVAPRRLSVRELDAKGRAVHLEGDYRKAAGRETGVFLVDAGKVNVGVTLRDGKTRVRPIATHGWLERERAALAAEPAATSYAARSTTTAVP